MEIEILDINLCFPSPLLAHVPLEVEVIANLSADRKHLAEAAELTQKWNAWAEDIKTKGVKDPGRFYREDGKCWFVDGRNRLHASREGGLHSFPGVEVSKEQASQIAISSLAHRKTTTKGALAYLAITLHPYLAGQGSGRKKEKPSDWAFRSLADLAAEIGVSESLMDEAVETFVYLRDRPEAKATIEPRVIAGITGLPGARAGAESSVTTKGKKRAPNGIREFRLTVATLKTHFKAATRWGDATKEEAVKEVAGLLKECPSARDIFQAAINALEGGGAQP